jgi:hypothetical protein
VKTALLTVVAALMLAAPASAATLHVENENESGAGSLGETITGQGSETRSWCHRATIP